MRSRSKHGASPEKSHLMRKGGKRKKTTVNQIIPVATAIVILMAMPIYFILPALQARLLDMEPDRAIRILSTSLAALFVLMTLPGLFALHMARKTIEEGRFPPENTWLLKGARVRSGASARTTALALATIGLFIICMGLWAAYVSYAKLPEIF